MSDVVPTPSSKKRAPTLYAIIAMKLGKGVLLLSLALGFYSLTDNNLPDEFKKVLRFVHLDPEKKFFNHLEEQLALVTPKNLMVVAWGSVIYSLFSIVEGIGLIYRVTWAGWLAIGESAFFIPIEIYELSRKFSYTVSVILVVNVVIVLYLYKNIHKLFHPMHPKPPQG